MRECTLSQVVHSLVVILHFTWVSWLKVWQQLFYRLDPPSPIQKQQHCQTIEGMVEHMYMCNKCR